jgi:hypothetical protein
MNCGLAFIADKLVGMHVSSVSNFGEKSKAENRTNKPSHALRGH